MEYEGDWQDFEELKQSFPCARCGAEPAAPCHDRNGRKLAYGSHAHRHNLAWSLIGFAARPPTGRQTELAAKLARAWE